MPPKNQNENPTQTDYENGLNAINKAEEKGTMGDSSGGNDSSIKNAEESPSNNWKNNVSSAGGGTRGNNTSSTAGNSWKNNVTSDHTGPSNTNVRFSSLKKKGPLAAIILVLGGGGASILLLGGIVAPIGFIGNVVDDLNDQFASLDIRNVHMLRNKIPSAERNKAIAGCRTLSIRCKFRTMSKTQIKKYEKAGIKVVGEKGGVLGNRIKPTEYVFENKSYGPKAFAEELKIKSGNSRLRYAFKRSLNMKYIGFSDKSFINVMEKFGISKKPPELKGTSKERAQALMNKTGGSIDDIKFTPIEGEDGKPTGEFQLEGDLSPNPRTYSQSDVTSMTKAVKNVKASIKPTRLTGATLKGLSILGAVDLACSVKNMVGLASVAAKVSNSVQLAKYAMPVMSLSSQMKAGEISEADAEALNQFFMDTDNRKTISEIAGTSVDNASVKDIPNPNYGKNAMNSDLYNMSVGGQVASSSINTQYSLGTGVNKLLSGVAKAAAVMDLILSVGDNNGTTCRLAQNWFVRGAGIIVAVAAAAGSGGGSIPLQAGIFAGVFGAFIAVNHILNTALSGSMFDGGMEDAPVERGAAVWTGVSVITGESAKNRGMMPGNSKQIIAYNQLQKSSNQDYIAMKSQEANPLDISDQYSFLGAFARSVGSYFTSSKSPHSAIHGISLLVSKGIASAINPQTAFAKTVDPSRFKKCDDDSYKEANIDADVQCNIRYVMPTEDLELDTDEVARYMEDNGYVEKDTTTGLPAGYTEPETSETQNFAMDLLNGTVNTFYNTRSYGDTSKGKEYGQFLDYCAYRAMPFGKTYEETDAFGSADLNWVDGSNCMKQGAPYSYFRIYTFDKSVNAAIDEEEATSDSTEPTTPTPSTGDAQQLAKEILANHKIDLSYSGSAHIPVRTDVQDAADGKVGSAGVMTDVRILQLIATLGQSHSVYVTAIQSGGMGHSTNSPHYSGKAVDFAILDGVTTTGRNSSSITIIKTAEKVWSAGRFGQSNCGASAPLPSGWVTFTDTCNHLHLDVMGV